MSGQRGVQSAIVYVAALDEISYCINCVDELSGQRGHFAYDEVRYHLGLGHYAIGPLFQDLPSLYSWAKREGFVYFKLKTMFTLSRTFE